MFKKVCHFMIWKEDVNRVIDALSIYGRNEFATVKDKDSYFVTISFSNKNYGNFLETMFRLTRSGLEIRRPIIRTTIFGLEL